MTGRYERPRLSATRLSATRLSRARQRAGEEAPPGPWQWPWRRQRRRRRVFGCLLWILTLLLMLLVLSILFGGFQRGSKVGGDGRPVRPDMVAARVVAGG
jgi:ABC-type Fe3+ transport system permease subunit